MDDCISVRFEENNNRSAAYDGDQEVGYCSYTLDGDVWVIEHTVVDPAYGGRGLAAVSWTLLSWEPGTAASRSCPCVPTP